MSGNGVEQQLFTVAEVGRALNFARSSIYRLIDKGHITLVDTPIGRRIHRSEVERLAGGKPIHFVRSPDPARQNAAAHARKGKAEWKAETARTVATTEELVALMKTVIERLDRFEASVTQATEDRALGPGKTPLGSRW